MLPFGFSYHGLMNVSCLFKRFQLRNARKEFLVDLVSKKLDFNGSTVVWIWVLGTGSRRLKHLKQNNMVISNRGIA